MPPSQSEPLTIGQCATLACLWEVSAPKPGNVHRGADFDDLTFEDFVLSSVAIGPDLDRAVDQPVGKTALRSIQATRRFVPTNTNLGIVLLLAPLATVPRGERLEVGLPAVLSRLTPQDAIDVYTAIRLAQAGGLGQVGQADVAGEPPASLMTAMHLAAERDLIARQYVSGFDTIFSAVVPWLLEGHAAGWPLSETIVNTHVRLMAQEPDSLIARKCGPETAARAARLAAEVLKAGQPGNEDYYRALEDLDFWLRSDGHRRNPGTTADLLAAGLFVLLRDGRLPA